MKTIATLAGASALAAVLGAPAYAQTEIAPGAGITGITGINERIVDVEDAVTDDFARSADPYRFGPASRREGTFGSVALTFTGRDGNNENQDFALGGRLSHNAGPFQQSVGILLEYSEDDDGNTDTEDTSVIYDASYSFNDRFYAFALGRLTTDGTAADFDDYDLGDPDDLADYTELDGRLKRDAFFGVGPGYRIINNNSTAWRMQAGVGVRYTQTVDVVDGAGVLVPAGERLDSETEVGYIVSSRFYHQFNDQLFVTNDTDFLSSDANDTITNALALNVRMSEAFSTRVSYTTEYVSDRDIRTDNVVGVSLVYGF